METDQGPPTFGFEFHQKLVVYGFISHQAKLSDQTHRRDLLEFDLCSAQYESSLFCYQITLKTFFLNFSKLLNVMIAFLKKKKKKSLLIFEAKLK